MKKTKKKNTLIHSINAKFEVRLCNRQCFACMFRARFRVYFALVMFRQRRMFVERRIMERHLVGG